MSFIASLNLGVRMLLRKQADVADQPVAPQGARRALLGGVVVEALNVKTALFFLAFLPQFVPADSPSKTVSFLLLGGWFVLQGTVFLLGLVAVCAQLGRLRTRPVLQRAVQAAGGLLFLALAVRLLKSGELPA